MFKRNQDILVIKKQHSDEVVGMKREMDGMKVLFKTMMKQQNPHTSDEEISNMMASPSGISTSTTAAPVDPHSSASTHIPRCEEVYSKLQMVLLLFFVSKADFVLWILFYSGVVDVFCEHIMLFFVSIKMPKAH